MNKKIGLAIFILLALIIIGIFFYNKTIYSEHTVYNANKTASNLIDTERNTSNDNVSSNNGPSNTSSTDSQDNSNSSNIQPTISETQLSAYSTKIYSNDPNRTTNMQITSSTLNETIVKSGEVFSFCNTIGPATSDKGYLEADIFDKDGNKKKGYGGGNCQISSTLYNAVLAVSNLTVIERHPHSNYVPYVEKGRDAAVAYGSYDFKFRNDSRNDIKILSSISDGLVNITILSYDVIDK